MPRFSVGERYNVSPLGPSSSQVKILQEVRRAADWGEMYMSLVNADGNAAALFAFCCHFEIGWRLAMLSWFVVGKKSFEVEVREKIWRSAVGHVKTSGRRGGTCFFFSWSLFSRKKSSRARLYNSL